MQAPWWWSKTETCSSDIYVYFNVNFNVFFKLIKVHLLVSELYKDTHWFVIKHKSFVKACSMLNDLRKLSFHYAWQQSASLNEIESFTELSTISAVAWDREEADLPDTWSYPDLPEPTTEGRNSCIKIGDHEI